MRTIGYGLGLAVVVAVQVTVDRIGISDDSSQISLLVLVVSAAVLGHVAPRWAWLAGLVLGSAIAVSAMAYAAWGPPPSHPMNPSGVGGAATLFALIVPALAGAYLGMRQRLALAQLVPQGARLQPGPEIKLLPLPGRRLERFELRLYFDKPDSRLMVAAMMIAPNR